MVGVGGVDRVDGVGGAGGVVGGVGVDGVIIIIIIIQFEFFYTYGLPPFYRFSRDLKFVVFKTII